MAYGTGQAFTVEWDTSYVIDALEQAKRDFRDLDYRLGVANARAASRELARATRVITQDIVIPALATYANASGVPIAPAMAETARAVNDRIPVVKVGKTQPKLSGFRRTKKAGRADLAKIRGALAWGSEGGNPTPKHWPGKAGRAVPGRPGWKVPGDVNHYKVPRNTGSGYWVQKAINSAQVRVPLMETYRQLVDQIFRKYGIY